MIGAAVAEARGVHPREVAWNLTPTKGLEFRTAQAIQRIADRLGRTAALEWIKALTRYQAQISDTAIRSALVSGNLNKIISALDPGKLQATLGKAAVQPLARTVVAAGKAGQAALRAHGIAATFNAAHPNVILYARTKAARMVVKVPREVKEVIRTVVSWGAERGVTVQQQARAIKEVVGLAPNHAKAPLRLADELRAGDLAAASRRFSAAEAASIRSRIMKGTVDDAFIDKMTATYTERLISLRATTIARTETLAAANYGQLEGWRQAIDAGLLPEDSRRFWIVTPSERNPPCKICLEIPELNPDGVGMDEPFETSEGPVDYPPAPHPNCRCAVGLVVGRGSRVK